MNDVESISLIKKRSVWQQSTQQKCLTTWHYLLQQPNFITVQELLVSTDQKELLQIADNIGSYPAISNMHVIISFLMSQCHIHI